MKTRCWVLLLYLYMNTLMSFIQFALRVWVSILIIDLYLANKLYLAVGVTIVNILYEILKSFFVDEKYELLDVRISDLDVRISDLDVRISDLDVRIGNVERDTSKILTILESMNSKLER